MLNIGLWGQEKWASGIKKKKPSDGVHIDHKDVTFHLNWKEHKQLYNPKDANFNQKQLMDPPLWFFRKSLFFY